MARRRLPEAPWHLPIHTETWARRRRFPPMTPDDSIWTERVRFGCLEYGGFVLIGLVGTLLLVTGVRERNWFLGSLGGLFTVLFVAIVTLGVLPRLRSGPHAHIAAPTSRRGTLVSFTALSARWPMFIVIGVTVLLVPFAALTTGLPLIAALLVSLGLVVTLVGHAVAVTRRVGPTQVALTPDHLTIGGLRPTDIPWDEVRAVMADPIDHQVHIRTSMGTEVITVVCPPLDMVAVMALLLTYASEPERRAVLGTPSAPADVAAVVTDRQLAEDVDRHLQGRS